MKVALAAYFLMERVAAAHGGINAAEAALLRSYQNAMGITSADIDAANDDEHVDGAIEGDDSEREATIRAMARIAHADGRLSARERSLILEVAEGLGIGRVRAANLVTHAADDGRFVRLHRRVSGHRRELLMLGLLTTLAIVFVWSRRPQRVEGGELQAIAARSDSALVLLNVSYDLVRGAERLGSRGEGSGFFVGSDGYLVTCKHVVQPWKFLADRVKLIDEGWTLDPDSVRITAWPAGARILYGAVLDRATAWDTWRGDLEVAATVRDRWVKSSRPLTSGGRHFGRYHALDNADLALLRARGDVPEGLALATRGQVLRPLDSIIVLGFPKGLGLIEGDRAVSAPSAGRVRKVEDTVLVSADIFPGNSGGPCVDDDGRVVGVAARRVGDESLGRCIQVSHVAALIESHFGDG